MPREKQMSDKRTILSMPADLKERVRKFRFQQELNTEAEALRLLIESGLKAFEERDVKESSK